MKLIINGKETQTESKTLSELAAELQLPAKGVALAVDNKIVPRVNWETFTPTEGQALTIIKAACGG